MPKTPAKTAKRSRRSSDDKIRKASIEETREKIKNYMSVYVPSLMRLISMRAARIKGVMTDDGGSQDIGIIDLDATDMYRVRYEVATTTGEFFWMFFECNLFRARIRFGLASEPPRTQEDYASILQPLSGFLQSYSWQTDFSTFDHPSEHFTEFRATVAMPKDYIWNMEAYMRLAEQVGAAMGVLILCAREHGFQTLASIPDRVEDREPPPITSSDEAS